MSSTLKKVVFILSFIGALKAYSVLKALFRYFYRLQQKKNLKKLYGSSSQGTWAVVTGSSSGIGVHFARQLASHGFNIVLVARRKDKLEEVSKAIQQDFPSVKTSVVCCDLMKLGQADHLCETFLQNIDSAIENGEIGVLVANAGNSDLARHFTDHSLERNRDMLNLNTLGNLALIQTLMPRLIRKDSRSCIVTVGALSAVTPLPGFATSSANKAYLRHLSLCIHKEYEENLDVLIAHPLAVKSEILSNTDGKKNSAILLGPDQFVEGILFRLGKGFRESFGWWVHDFMGYIVSDIMSYERRSAYWVKNIPRYSELLDRPVNLKPIQEKLQQKQTN